MLPLEKWTIYKSKKIDHNNGINIPIKIMIMYMNIVIRYINKYRFNYC